MSRTTMVMAALGGALVGAGFVWHRSRAEEHQAIEGSTIIPIITPTIEIETAEEVLSRMEHIQGDEISLLLHTEGGCVTACVMIADALRQFRNSTAIVPYMAISGGTLIALNARQLRMGRNAVLSAVDPQIYGQRAKHIPEKAEDGLHPFAQEYDHAVGEFLKATLQARLQGRGGPYALDRAMDVFMGEHVPHAWPIKIEQIRELGLPVALADKPWATAVDSVRQGQLLARARRLRALR